MAGMHPAIARRLGLPPDPTGAPQAMPSGNPEPPEMPGAPQPGMLPPNPIRPNSMGQYVPNPVDYGLAMNPQMMGRPALTRLPLLPRPQQPGMP